MELKVSIRRVSGEINTYLCQEKGRWRVRWVMSAQHWTSPTGDRVVFNHQIAFPAQRKRSQLTTVPVKKELPCFPYLSLQPQRGLRWQLEEEVSEEEGRSLWAGRQVAWTLKSWFRLAILTSNFLLCFGFFSLKWPLDFCHLKVGRKAIGVWIFLDRIKKSFLMEQVWRERWGQKIKLLLGFYSMSPVRSCNMFLSHTPVSSCGCKLF